MPKNKLIINHKSFTLRFVEGLVVSILVGLSIVTGQLSLVAGEVSPLEKAQNDYSFQTTKFQDVKEKYQTARSSYLTFKTATAKNEAFLKSKDYLTQVHNLYIAYLFLINERANTVDWSKTTYERQKVSDQVTAEIKFLEDDKKKAQDAQTLEEIPKLASDLAIHISTVTLKTAFITLATTDLAQIEDVTTSFDETATKVDTYSQKLNINEQFHLNWKSEVETIKTKTKDATQDPKKKLDTAISLGNYPYKSNNFEFDTSLARQILSRTKSLLREITNYQ